MLNINLNQLRKITVLLLFLLISFQVVDLKAQSCGQGIPPLEPQTWQMACTNMSIWCGSESRNCTYQVCYCYRIYYDPVLLKDIYQIQIYSIVPDNWDCCPYLRQNPGAFDELIFVALDKIVTENPNNLPFVIPSCYASSFCQNYYSIFECYAAMCWDKTTGYSCLYPGSAWCKEEERVCRDNQGNVVICQRTCTIVGSISECPPGNCTNIQCLCQ